MFSPTLTVVLQLLQLLLLLEATNASATIGETTSATTKGVKPTANKPTIAPVPKSSSTRAMTTAESTTSASGSNCSPLTPGALAGIIVVVVIIYLLSLLLTAFIVSYYTKKGTLDLDKLIFGRMPFAKIRRRTRDSVTLAHSPEEPNDYIENPESSVYMHLEGNSRGPHCPDDSMYTALESVSRLPSDSKDQPTTSNSLAVPQGEGGKAPQSPTTPKHIRSRKRDETEPKKPTEKPKIKTEKPNLKADDDTVYMNAASMKPL